VATLRSFATPGAQRVSLRGEVVNDLPFFRCERRQPGVVRLLAESFERFASLPRLQAGVSRRGEERVVPAHCRQRLAPVTLETDNPKAIPLAIGPGRPRADGRIGVAACVSDCTLRRLETHLRVMPFSVGPCKGALRCLVLTAA
jgi:hypothetical protein